MECDFGKIISTSLRRSVHVLFAPFSLKKWMAWLFIAWLAGALGTGGGNINVGNLDRAQKAEAYPVREGQFYSGHENSLQETIDQMREITVESSLESSLDLPSEEGATSQDVFPTESEEVPSAPKLKPKEIAVIVIILILVGLPFLLLFSWLSARFKFVWYDAVVHNQLLIGEPFEKYKKEGNSLFLLFLYYGAVFWFILFALGGWAYFAAKGAGVFIDDFVWSFMTFLKLFGLPLLFFAGLIIVSIFYVFIVDHFLVPIMAIDRVSFVPGVKKFFSLFNKNQKNCWLFLLISFGLSILCGIFSMIVFMMILIILGLLALVVFGSLFLLTSVFMKMKVLFAVLAVVLGIPFLAMAFLLFLSIALPIGVFYRHLSLYFLASISAVYAPLSLDLSSGDVPASGDYPSF